MKIVAALVASLLTVAACSRSDAHSTVLGQAGGTHRVLNITVGTENEPGRPENDAVVEFARLVEKESGGEIRVKIQYNLEQVTDPPEPLTAEAVSHHKVDLALTGASSWAALGAPSLRVLQAPFVVRTRTQAFAVPHDKTLVSELFSGLDGASVVGLALVPEDFRMIVDYTNSVTGPGDLAHRTVRTRASSELRAFYESLGAKVDVWGNDTDLREFTVDQQAVGRVGTVIGNLPVYFRFGTLVANADFWKSLQPNEQSRLLSAADEMEQFAQTRRSEEASQKEIAAYCDRAGSVAWLSPDAITSFERAVAPLIESMSADSTYATELSRLRALSTDTVATTFPECHHQKAAAAFPEGTYRFEVAMADLLPFGPAQQVPENLGVYTYIMKNGRFSWNQQAGQDVKSGPTTPTSGEGTYTVDGDRITMVEPGGPDLALLPTVLRWSADASHNLHFALVSSTLEYVKWLYAKTWIRIGG